MRLLAAICVTTIFLLVASFPRTTAAHQECSIDGGIRSCGEYPDTPSGGGGSSGGATGGMTPQQQIMMQGAATVGYAVGQELHKALFGDPAEEAAKQAAAAQAAELARQRQLAEEKRKEEAKKRLLGQGDGNGLHLMGLHNSPGLQIIPSGSSSSSLHIIKSGDSSAPSPDPCDWTDNVGQWSCSKGGQGGICTDKRSARQYCVFCREGTRASSLCPRVSCFKSPSCN